MISSLVVGMPCRGLVRAAAGRSVDENDPAPVPTVRGRSASGCLLGPRGVRIALFTRLCSSCGASSGGLVSSVSALRGRGRLGIGSSSLFLQTGGCELARFRFGCAVGGDDMARTGRGGLASVLSVGGCVFARCSLRFGTAWRLP